MHELGTCLYYMAPIKNVPGIVLLGIFSFNKRRGMPVLDQFSESIADPSVNDRRHHRTIDGRSLHDYVPLYWATHTPMQYVVTIRDRRVRQDDLAFFVINAGSVSKIEGVLSTDGNAASQETTFYRGLYAMEQIDWNIVGTRDCYTRDYKREKCAEVLVPDHVPNDQFLEIVVRNAELADAFGGLLASVASENESLLPRKIPVVPRPDFYYPEHP